MQGNHFGGSNIPKCLGDLRRLTILNLAWCNLSGSVPAELAALTRLEMLSLNGNKLSGSLPEQLAELKALTTLELEDNALTGLVPNFPFSSIRSCYLQSQWHANQYSCPLPPNSSFCQPHPPTCYPGSVTSWPALRTALQHANASDIAVHFSHDFNTSSYDGAILIRELLNHRVVIDAKHAVLDARHVRDRFFIIESNTGEVVLQNFVFLNSNCPAVPSAECKRCGNHNGCSIYVDGTVSISITRTRIAWEAAYSVKSQHNGGGLFAHNGAHVEIRDSSISGCRQIRGWGSALSIEGASLVMFNTLIFNNTNACPVYLSRSKALVKNCIFESNDGWGGSAIAIAEDTESKEVNAYSVQIRSTQFTSNRGYGNSWTIQVSCGANGTCASQYCCQNCSFANNTPRDVNRSIVSFQCPEPATSTAAPTTTTAAPATTSAPAPVPAFPTPKPIKGSSVPFTVAGSCLVAIIVVAVVVATKKQLDKKRKGPLNKPLLEDNSIDSELLVLRDAAEFDIETGAPINAASQQLCVLQWQAGEPESVRQLPYSQIEVATGGFGAANRLAGGGSCTVFQGSLFGLMEVAVKQLHSDADEWNNTQFETEMQLLCTVTHDNICCLLAFSADGPSRCLVLELCTGGALDTRLACKAVGEGPKPEPLKWAERLAIAVGIASALVHLHLHRPQLLHRDLKAANVLIDGAGKAKVADFGTVREGPTKQSGDTHMQTERRVGTRVYMYVAFMPLLLIVHLCGMGSNTYFSPPTHTHPPHTHPPIPPARPPTPPHPTGRMSTPSLVSIRRRRTATPSA
jgi:hypothetical protein